MKDKLLNIVLLVLSANYVITAGFLYGQDAPLTRVAANLGISAAFLLIFDSRRRERRMREALFRVLRETSAVKSRLSEILEK